MLINRLRLLCVCLLCVASTAVGDDSLTIGSPAPPLDIEHWVQDGDGKFPHVTEFESGKVYLVEFWATWCGPCIGAMPTIAQLQEEYADKGVQVVSISTESLETVEGFLERTVRGAKKTVKDDDEGDDEKESEVKPKTYADLTSTYCLTTDPDKSASNDYMRASGQRGIPCSFLVGKTGKIEWIGHPMSLEGPLEAVVNDQWDRAAFAEEYKNEKLAESLMNEVRAKMRAKDPEAAIELINETIASSSSKTITNNFRSIKFQVLASTPSMADEFIAFSKELLADDSLSPNAVNMVGWTIYQRAAGGKFDDVEALQIAVDATLKAAEKVPGSASASIYDTAAHLYEVLGELDSAIETQMRAVKASSANEQVTDYLKELKEKAADSE